MSIDLLRAPRYPCPLRRAWRRPRSMHVLKGLVCISLKGNDSDRNTNHVTRVSHDCHMRHVLKGLV